MMDELNWFDHAARGIDVESLGLDDADLAKLAVSSRADVMAHLAAWNGGVALGDSTRDRVNASSAVAVLTVPGDNPPITCGAAWLLNGCGCGPVGTIWVCNRCHRCSCTPRSEHRPATLSADFAPRSTATAAPIQAAVGQKGDTPVLVLRLSHDAPPPTVRSRRLDRDRT